MADYTHFSEAEVGLMALMLTENGSDPHSYEEASQNRKWRKAMEFGDPSN